MQATTTQRRGFTLVELLVVIAIIATLAALLTPAVIGALTAARNAAIKLEVTKIEQGIENYKNKHGDYPPDFSDPAIVTRHYRKLFPRMAADELAVVNYITDPTNVTIDRAEALFLALHGYSSDPTHPLTGPGGPLDATTISSGTVTLGGSTGMVKSVIEFEESLITWELSGGSYISTDGVDSDVFPTYQQRATGTPFVYFDSRTYIYKDSTAGWKVNDYSDVNNSLAGTAQPYKTDQPTPKKDPNEVGLWSTTAENFKFANPNKYQIISAGQDGKFSSFPVVADTARIYPTGTGYKSEDLDNVTNFSQSSTLQGDMP